MRALGHISVPKIMFIHQTVQLWECWKTDRHTDAHKDGTDSITLTADAGGKNRSMKSQISQFTQYYHIYFLDFRTENWSYVHMFLAHVGLIHVFLALTQTCLSILGESCILELFIAFDRFMLPNSPEILCFRFNLLRLTLGWCRVNQEGLTFIIIVSNLILRILVGILVKFCKFFWSYT